METTRVNHLEIETYTFNVLPVEIRSVGIAKSIVREFEGVVNKVRECVSSRI